MVGLKQQFDLPGFAATVLAPSDGAFAVLLNGTPTLSVLSETASCNLQVLLDGMPASMADHPPRFASQM